MSELIDCRGRSILVVGAGSIGRRHLKNICRLWPEARRVVYCRPESLELVSGEADRVVHTIEEACAEVPLFAVVANPAPYHIEIAQMLVDRRCHVLIEKPLSHSLEGISQLIASSEKSSIVVMVGYSQRFVPSLEALVKVAQSGRLGKILHISAEVGQYLPDWRAGDYRKNVSANQSLGGGALMELSHEVDLVLRLGGCVGSVMGSVSKVSNLDLDVDDLALALLDFRSGTKACLQMDMVQRVLSRRCRVVGELATAEWDHVRDTTRIGTPDKVWTEEISERVTDRNEIYLSELAYFSDCINKGLPPKASLAEGLQVLRVLLAIKESSLEGRTVALSDFGKSPS